MKVSFSNKIEQLNTPLPLATVEQKNESPLVTVEKEKTTRTVEQVWADVIAHDAKKKETSQEVLNEKPWQEAGKRTRMRSAKKRHEGELAYQRELDTEEYLRATTKSLARLNDYIVKQSINIANMSAASITTVVEADSKLYHAFKYIQRHTSDQIRRLSPKGNLESLKRVLATVNLERITSPVYTEQAKQHREEQKQEQIRRQKQSAAARAEWNAKKNSVDESSDNELMDELFTSEQLNVMKKNRRDADSINATNIEKDANVTNEKKEKNDREAASINVTAANEKLIDKHYNQATQKPGKQQTQQQPSKLPTKVTRSTTKVGVAAATNKQAKQPTANKDGERRLYAFVNNPTQNIRVMFDEDRIDAWDLASIMSSVVSSNTEVCAVIEDHLMSIDACNEVDDNKKGGGKRAERKNDGIDKFIQRARRVIEGKEREEIMDLISRNLNDKKWCKCLVDAAMNHHDVTIMSMYASGKDEVTQAMVDTKRYVYTRYLNIVKLWLEDKGDEIISVASMRMIILHTLYRDDDCMSATSLEQMLAGTVRGQGTGYSKRAIETMRLASEMNFDANPKAKSTTIELEIVEEENNVNYMTKKLIKVVFDNSKNVEALARAHNALMHSITGNGTNDVFIKDWNMLVDKAKDDFSSKCVLHECDPTYNLAASQELYRKHVRNTRSTNHALHLDYQMTEAPLSVDLRMIQDELVAGRWIPNDVANYGANVAHSVNHQPIHFCVDHNIAARAQVVQVLPMAAQGVFGQPGYVPQVHAVAAQAAIRGHCANENGYGLYMGSGAYCIGTSAKIEGSTVYKKTLGIEFSKFNGMYQDINGYSAMNKQLAHYANKHTIKLMSDHVIHNATETTTSGKTNELMKLVGYAAALTPMLGPATNIDGYTCGPTANVPEPCGQIYPLGDNLLLLGNIRAITMTMSAYIKWHETGAGCDVGQQWRSDMINNTIAVIPVTTDMANCKRTLAAMTLLKLEYPYQRIMRDRPVILNETPMTVNPNHSSLAAYNALQTRPRNSLVASVYTNVRMPSNIIKIIYVLVDPQMTATAINIDHPNRGVGIAAPVAAGAVPGILIPVPAAPTPLIDVNNQGQIDTIGAAGFAPSNINQHLYMWFNSLSAIDWYRTADMFYEIGTANHEQMAMAQRKMAQLCPLYTPMQASRYNGGANDTTGLIDYSIDTVGANLGNNHEEWRVNNSVETHTPTCWSLLTNSIGQRMLPRAEIRAGVATSKVSAHDDRVDVLLAARICTLFDPLWMIDVYQPTLQATYKINELSLTYAKLVDTATNTLGLPMQVIGGGSDAIAGPHVAVKTMSQQNLIGCAESEMFWYSDDLDKLTSLADIGAVVSTRVMINSYRGNYRPITTAAQEANGHLLFAKERPLVRTFLRTSYQDEIKDYKHTIGLSNWAVVDDNDGGLGDTALRAGSIQLSTQTARDLLTTLPLLETQDIITAIVKRVRAQQHAGAMRELWYTHGVHEMIRPLNVLLGNEAVIDYRIPLWSNPFVFDFDGATKCTAHAVNNIDTWIVDNTEVLTVVTYDSNIIIPRRTIDRRVFNIDPLATVRQLTELEQKELADADTAQTARFLEGIAKKGIDIHDLKGRFLPPNAENKKKPEERKGEEEEAEKKRKAAILKDKENDALNNKTRTGFDEVPNKAGEFGAAGQGAGVNI